MTTGISINPTKQEFGEAKPAGFSALVLVEKSRYVKSEYPPDTGWTPKISIEWTLKSTKGNIFKKNWSTGLQWDGSLATISPDGKRLIPKSPECKGYKQNADAVFFIESILKTSFPANLLTDDISVFEGHAFYIADAKNPRWTGSKIKPYPKTYYPEGFTAAMTTQQAKQAEKQAAYGGNKFQSANEAPVSSYQPPQVVLAMDILGKASEALTEILTGNGGKIEKKAIISALQGVKKDWDLVTRQKVTLALWNQLAEVVGTSPIFKLDGDTVSINV